MAPELQKVSTHHWLKHRSEPHFHAYLSGKRGENAMCSDGQPIAELRDMDIPGDRSLCCIKCMSALYGFTPSTAVKEKS